MRLARSVLVGLATIYKIFQAHFDRALGAACLDKVRHKGQNCVFEGDGRIIDPDKIRIGNDSYIGRNFFIRATGGLYIGSHTHISRNVTLHTVNHNTDADILPYDRTNNARPIHIGDFVWIGMNCSVLPGVKIGDGAIIGMGTTVSKDVAAGAIVVGASQRVVGERDLDKMQRLSQQQKFLEIKNGWASK